MTDLAHWLETARQALGAVSDQPSLEAQAILGNTLGKSKAWIFGHSEFELSPNEIKPLNQRLNQRCAGVPLPYVLGQWEFYGLDFEVNPAVLIPRPETEGLVELGQAWLKSHPHQRRGVDVGTGSGCIAVSLAHVVPDLHVVAVDLSMDALKTAGRNIARHKVSQRVSLVQSDLCSAFSGPFDLACANLPYIPSQTVEEIEVAKYEPRFALDGGPDGLRLIEITLAQLCNRMATGGMILLEIEYSQGISAPRLARQYYPRAEVQLHKDFAGLPRMVSIQLPE